MDCVRLRKNGNHIFVTLLGGSGNCVAASLVYSSTGIMIDQKNLMINSLGLFNITAQNIS